MENEKSPKEEISNKEVDCGEDHAQATYIPDSRQISADTRSKTCGITWKLHRAEEEASDDSP